MKKIKPFLDLSKKKNEKKFDNETIRAAIYARTSSIKQNIGYSINEQTQLARERCDQNGWKVTYIFREDGKSAATTDRPKFQAMMKKAQEKAFDVIIFWKLDRFCRSLLDVVNVEKKLRELGVNICSITENLDTTTSSGRFVFRTLASAAQWEREMISERTAMGLKALAKQHKWPNKSTPLGYIRDNNGYLKINKKEAKLVQEIFHKYNTMKSMPQLAFLLNKRGLKTKRGKKWTAAAIKTILTNEIYIGKYNVADIKADIPNYRIIREKTFKKTQKNRLRQSQNVEAMPHARKTATVKKIFDEYFSFLKEEEQYQTQGFIN